MLIVGTYCELQSFNKKKIYIHSFLRIFKQYRVFINLGRIRVLILLKKNSIENYNQTIAVLFKKMASAGSSENCAHCKTQSSKKKNYCLIPSRA